MLIKVICFILLLAEVLSAGKYWYSPNEITGGLLEIIPSANVGTVQITFPLSYKGTSNYVVLGGNTFGVSSIDNNFKFQIAANSITSTGFTFVYTLNSNNTFRVFFSSYLFINRAKINTGIQVLSINYTFGSLTPSGTVSYSASLSSYPINQIRLLFVYGIFGTTDTPNMVYDVYPFQDEATLQIKFRFIFRSTLIQYLAIKLVIIDPILQINHNITCDSGYIEINAFNPIIFPIPSNLVTSNFISGFNSVDIDKSTSSSFTYENGSYQYTGIVRYINITYLNFRKWKCAPNTFYRSTDDSCIALCDIGKFGNPETQICESCLTTCYTCNYAENCSSCVENYFRKLDVSTSQCLCNETHFDDGINVLCANCSVGCSKCLTQSQCTLCLTRTKQYNFYGINHIFSYVLTSLKTCIYCNQQMNNCLTCSDYNKCTSCVHQNFTVNANQDQCICNENNQFFLQRDRCYLCNQIIKACVLCTSNITCFECITLNYTMGINNRTCNCDISAQYFDWNENCVLCKDLILGCTTCQNNNTCLFCDQNALFRLQGSICVCIDGYYLSEEQCLPCQDSCLTCTNSSTFCLTCNNSALRQFNQNTCQCTFPFSDCRTSGNSACNNKTCSYLRQTKLQIVGIIKNPSNNSLQITIFIDPITNDLKQSIITQLFHIGDLLNSTIVYTYSNGLVTVDINYEQNLQGLSTKMTLNMSQIGKWYFDLAPNVDLNYNIIPTNNLASNVYSQQLYTKRLLLNKIVIAVTIASIIVYLIGIWHAKIIVGEMISVVQLAFIGLFIVNHSDPLINSLNYFGLSLGVDGLFSINQQRAPDRIYAVGFSYSSFTNLNLLVLLFMIPPIVSFIFYRIHVVSTKYRIRMQKNWKLVLGQWMLTLFLLCMYSYSSSLIGLILFSRPNGYQFYLSIIEILILTVLLGFLISVFVKKDKIWMGQYKQNFNWNNFSQFYYLFPISQRFLIGVIITAGNMSFASAIVCILIQCSCLIMVAIKKPFVSSSQNYRSIITNTYSITILSFYLSISAYGPSKGQSTFTYIPYAIVSVVTLNILTGLGFTIFQILKYIKLLHHQNKCQLQSLQQQKLHLQMNKQMKKRIKQSKQVKKNKLHLIKKAQIPVHDIVDQVDPTHINNISF